MLLTLADVARHLNVSEKSVRLEIIAGKLKAEKSAGQFLITDESLKEYLSVRTGWVPRERKVSHALPANLVTKSEIIKAAKPLASSCGVYFLIDGEEVVYVGKSLNVFTRVPDHAKEKQFDRWCYIAAREVELDAVESFYINAFLPALNIVTPRIADSSGLDLECRLAKIAERETWEVAGG